jgi:hypothetical protein
LEGYLTIPSYSGPPFSLRTLTWRVCDFIAALSLFLFSCPHPGAAPAPAKREKRERKSGDEVAALRGGCDVGSRVRRPGEQAGEGRQRAQSQRAAQGSAVAANTATPIRSI